MTYILFRCFTFFPLSRLCPRMLRSFWKFVSMKSVSYAYRCSFRKITKKLFGCVRCRNKISPNWRQQSAVGQWCEKRQKYTRAVAASAHLARSEARLKTVFSLFALVSRIFDALLLFPHMFRERRTAKTCELVYLTAHANYLINECIFSGDYSTASWIETLCVVSGAWDVEIKLTFRFMYCTFASARLFAHFVMRANQSQRSAYSICFNLKCISLWITRASFDCAETLPK